MAMVMTGEVQLPASREVVWAKLNDADVLKACIPGCEELNKASDIEFQAVAVVKIGPVKARFKGKVNLTDLNPPNGYRISGDGEGGVAGFAKGGAQVSLGDEGEQTRLSYAASAQVGGKLAQIGSRLIDAAARKMADDFFARFNQVVTRRAGLAPEAAPPPAPAPTRGLPTWVWVVALVVLALLVLYLMTRPGF